jgi:hypothetical protein
MPRAQRPRPPASDDRQAALPLPPARRKPPTPEQIAQIVVAKLKSPVGMPDKAELPLRLILPRAVLERVDGADASGKLPQPRGLGAGGAGARGDGLGAIRESAEARRILAACGVREALKWPMASDHQEALAQAAVAAVLQSESSRLFVRSQLGLVSAKACAQAYLGISHEKPDDRGASTMRRKAER